ncbi:MAG: MBL fold metallo-hydrolase [Clostridia bacterium]|nr:MBL fold metallo-hydrolase [Clostridia bacterium]
MTIVKSFSVGDGDMFYIKHSSDNFTVIDCYMHEENKNDIMDEIKEQSKYKSIHRFISTHPDEDHILGLKIFRKKIGITNFYCVENEATKKEETEDFKEYCDLRDGEQAFYVYNGCKRKWMNMNGEDDSGNEIGSAGINILWPERNNKYFKEELEKAKNGESPNNISPIIKYSMDNGVDILWFGDLESDFMENIKNDLNIEEADIIFAPHHGRDSGKIPKEILEKINPKIIVIGEAPSNNLNYYNGYNTITQNSAGDITFSCEEEKVHIYVSNNNYSVKFLKNEHKCDEYGWYLGTLEV